MNAITPTSFRFPEGRQQGCELRFVSGLPVLCVSGAPEEMGEAIGALALRPAPRMAGYPTDMMRRLCAGWLAPMIARVGNWMVDRFEPAFRNELEAIVRASGVERRNLVIGNTLFDLKKILACSAFLVEKERSKTGSTLLGRNLDYPSLDYAHEYSLVTIYRPTGKRAFVSVGFPGLVGVLSGMNQSGLTLSVLEVYQGPMFLRRLDPGGVPYALCFRKLLEECDTIDQARRMLERMRRTTLYNVVLADRDRVAVFEVTPGKVRERRAEAGVAICTNHFCARGLQPLFPVNVFDTFDRQRVLRQAERKQERFGVADLQRNLHAVNQDDHTLQTMVFEPGELRLHLAVGQLPASGGPLATLELDRLFREGLRAVDSGGQS